MRADGFGFILGRGAMKPSSAMEEDRGCKFLIRIKEATGEEFRV